MAYQNYPIDPRLLQISNYPNFPYAERCLRPKDEYNCPEKRSRNNTNNIQQYTTTTPRRSNRIQQRNQHQQNHALNQEQLQRRQDLNQRLLNIYQRMQQIDLDILRAQRGLLQSFSNFQDNKEGFLLVITFPQLTMPQFLPVIFGFLVSGSTKLPNGLGFFSHDVLPTLKLQYYPSSFIPNERSWNLRQESQTRTTDADILSRTA
ncbi:9459_t:CDS:2 [Diversispora eburnea]|uniref:9459_t:CDS:1 n=1 Tax=Diversispora eburnea TaxID=1213867 RepID=A0A9N9GC08_9GLOM|nr:9459_t:CDS:2 [Diversispora eburnea]